MNRLQQQLQRVLVFVKQHGNASDKLAAIEVEDALLHQQGAPEDSVRGIPRCQKCGNLEPFHASGCPVPYGDYTQPAQQGADASLRVAVNSLVESARCLGTSDSQESIDHWAEKVEFYRDQIYRAQQGVPEGWRLVEKAACYQLACGNEVVATLAGPNAEENAATLAALLAAAPRPPVEQEEG